MFIAYEVSLELIRELRTAAQIRTAATSVTLSLCEGQRSGGGNQRWHDELAHGSANELKGALAVAEAWGWSGGAARSRETSIACSQLL
jgi:four helix bundle protein